MAGLIKLFRDVALAQELSSGSWSQTLALPTITLPVSGNVLSSGVPGYGMNLGTTTMQAVSLQAQAGSGLHGADFAANIQIAPDVTGTPGSYGADGASTVLVSGNLVPAKASPSFNTASPSITNPSTLPTLSEITSAGTNLAAGTYTVGYTFTNAGGETLLSPTTTITISAGSSIHIASISLGTNATGVNYYMSALPGRTEIYLGGSNSGSVAINLTGALGFFKFWMRQDVNVSDPTGNYQAQLVLSATDIG